MSKGIDVSHNNGVIDWQKVKADGIDFAMIRAGHGTTEDRQFKNNMAGAEKAGLAIGIWHFSYATDAAGAEAEAAKCASLIKPYKIELPVFFDFEYYAEAVANPKVAYTKALRTAIHKAFCNKIRAAGYTSGIYTNVDYITNRLDWGELSSNALWLAQWPFGASRNISWSEVKDTAVSAKYGRPAIWQIGKGRVNGIGTDTDYNYGYFPLPEKPVAPTSAAPSSPASTPLKAGDKVMVQNTTMSGAVRRGSVYGGGTFVLYRDIYDVISVSGRRVVIGVGKAVTAAVDIGNLQKV